MFANIVKNWTPPFVNKCCHNTITPPEFKVWRYSRNSQLTTNKKAGRSKFKTISFFGLKSKLDDYFGLIIFDSRHTLLSNAIIVPNVFSIK